eukprot:5858205-Pyramimonas_sp.AAC.1
MAAPMLITPMTMMGPRVGDQGFDGISTYTRGRCARMARMVVFDRNCAPPPPKRARKGVRKIPTRARERPA